MISDILQSILMWPVESFQLARFESKNLQAYVPLAAGIGAAYWMGVDGGGLMGYGRAYLVGGVASYAGAQLVAASIVKNMPTGGSY